MKKHNFSSGPAILPESVFQEAAEAIKDLDGKGLSILEISHRSDTFSAILEEARRLPKELLGLPEDYEVLYLTGGASSQFYMVPMNFLNEGETVGFLDTGSWSTKAIKEAKLFGQVEVVASSAADNFSYIPKEYTINKNLKYLHLTSNNTIYGTQIFDWPQTEIPLVCDMSSDIFSRAIDYRAFSLIYAGAQKNLGPAGTTMVILKRDTLQKVSRAIPTMLDYQTHIKKHSAFNTPPVFPIYVSMLNLRWIKEEGGIAEMEKRNREKAALFYKTLDELDFFKALVRKEDRSIMNATFALRDEKYNSAFEAACDKANISTIKGHRSVGGFRASMYNAMPLSSVEVLTEVMSDFARKNG